MMKNKAGKDILPADWIEMENYVNGLENENTSLKAQVKILTNMINKLKGGR